jgi:hypothetical protein
VSFAFITLYVASQRVFIVVVYFVINAVRGLLDTPSYFSIFSSYLQLVRGGSLCRMNNTKLDVEVF